MSLQDRLRASMAAGPVTTTDLVNDMEDAGSVDLQGSKLIEPFLAALGTTGLSPQEAAVADLVDNCVDADASWVRLWIDPPKGRNILAAVALVEQTPMGVKTDPEFDLSTLDRLVRAYNQARKAGAPSAQLKRRAQSIHDALLTVVAQHTHARLKLGRRDHRGHFAERAPYIHKLVAQRRGQRCGESVVLHQRAIVLVRQTLFCSCRMP